MSNKEKVVITEFICPECYNIMPLSRKKGVQKKVYHKKVLWCPVCQKRINHIELRNKDILEKELEFKTNKSEEDAFVYTLIKKSNECRKNI